MATRRATLADRECWGCGREGANGHHLVPRDWTKPGPDEDWNIISLCGSGTMLCHGTMHGAEYVDASGQRRSRTSTGAAIIARLSRDPERARQLLAFLGDTEHVVRFFGRVLGVGALSVTSRAGVPTGVDFGWRQIGAGRPPEHGPRPTSVYIDEAT